ncbi:hypothetical protein [Candidatus Mesenet endosymbiont of Phosphuga atrata]|uniref:hypothetical protein n=1 Tax=Candidatus Mesenet endosymbiont of Phosphuga atrata TaxID=3066221 RepID=UPI0030CDEF74
MSNNEELINKLAGYNNIQSSIKKLTNDRVKQEVLTVLNGLSDEQLQRINQYSSVFDFFILKDIETENSININFHIEFHILNKSDNELDKITKRKELFDILKPCYGFLFQELWSLNDDQFARVIEEPSFIKALASIGAIDQDVLRSIGNGSYLNFFQRNVQKLNQSFDRCIENKDLVLIYSLLLKTAYLPHSNYEFGNITKFMHCTHREDMIKALYDLHQYIQELLPSNHETYSKQVFNLMVSNSKAIEQVLYNDSDDSITKTLVDSDFQKIKTLICTRVQQLKQVIRRDIPGFKYNNELIIEGTGSGNSPAKLETISSMEFMGSKNKEHLIKDYKIKSIAREECTKLSESHAKDVEKNQQREIKLSQVTQAIPDKERDVNLK